MNCRNTSFMKGVPSTSTTLLRTLAADSQHARWAEFVARYEPMMKDYLRAHFPTLEAEDIISETLVALVDALGHYRYAPDETGHFRNYLTGILKHKALRQRSVADRRVRNEAEFGTDPTATADSGEGGEVREWKEAVFAIALRQLLAAEDIEERTKQVFLRVAVNHESPESVADSLGLKRNAVDQIKSRMTARLREIVATLKDII